MARGSDEGTHHEDVARVWTLSSDPQQLEEVPELPVNVPADCHGRCDGLNVGFLHQERPHHLTQVLHCRLGQEAALAQLCEVQIGVEVVHWERDAWRTARAAESGGRRGGMGAIRGVGRVAGGDVGCGTVVLQWYMCWELSGSRRNEEQGEEDQRSVRFPGASPVFVSAFASLVRSSRDIV